MRARYCLGSDWKPIYNRLEEGFTLMLANARHIKAVPGRKTDVSDAEWIAGLLQHGLIRPSFVPHESNGNCATRPARAPR